MFFFTMFRWQLKNDRSSQQKVAENSEKVRKFGQRPILFLQEVDKIIKMIWCPTQNQASFFSKIDLLL